jgi:hypothetical protein
MQITAIFDGCAGRLVSSDLVGETRGCLSSGGRGREVEQTDEGGYFCAVAETAAAEGHDAVYGEGSAVFYDLEDFGH